MHIFSNIIGVFVFDDQLNVVDEISFKNLKDYQNKDNFIGQMRSRHESLQEPGQKILGKILAHFKGEKFFNVFYNRNIELTKLGLKNSVSGDILLIQSINSIDEISKASNMLSKRLREWYELYNPEFSRATSSHEKFVFGILEKEKPELLEGLKLELSQSMGADLQQEDLEPVKSLARQIYDLHQLGKKNLDYVSSLMDRLCPNMKAVCGQYIGAKLIEHAGSLRRLSEMPASTIQVLGAEQALFRHMKTGAKPPRHGIIASHPLIAQAPDKMHGRIARALADKISIASKIDYFRGKFIGDKLKQWLEAKFGK